MLHCLDKLPINAIGIVSTKDITNSEYLIKRISEDIYKSLPISYLYQYIDIQQFSQLLSEKGVSDLYISSRYMLMVLDLTPTFTRIDNYNTQKKSRYDSASNILLSGSTLDNNLHYENVFWDTLNYPITQGSPILYMGRELVGPGMRYSYYVTIGVISYIHAPCIEEYIASIYATPLFDLRHYSLLCNRLNDTFISRILTRAGECPQSKKLHEKIVIPTTEHPLLVLPNLSAK